MKTIRETSNPKRKLLIIEAHIASDEPLTPEQLAEEIENLKKKNRWGKKDSTVHEELVAYTRCTTVIRITRLRDI